MNSIEKIDVIFGVEDSSLPISDVVLLLEGFQGMTKSLNLSLNKSYSCGFDDVSLEVIGFEHGSLRIPFCIRKIYSNWFIPISKEVIAQLIFWLFTAGSDTYTVQTQTGPVTIQRAEFDKNKALQDFVNKIASTVVNSDKITNMSLCYKDANHQEVTIQINKKQMTGLIKEIDDSTSCYDIPRVTVQIVSPTLEAKSVQWKVRYEGKVRPMKMNDIAFLTLIDHRDISFRKGDVLICDIQLLETIELDGSVKQKYIITKVYDWPHYHRLEETKEQDLFE